MSIAPASNAAAVPKPPNVIAWTEFGFGECIPGPRRSRRRSSNAEESIAVNLPFAVVHLNPKYVHTSLMLLVQSFVLGCDHFELDVHVTRTIEWIRSMVAKQYSKPAEEVRLLHHGRELLDKHGRLCDVDWFRHPFTLLCLLTGAQESSPKGRGKWLLHELKSFLLSESKADWKNSIRRLNAVKARARDLQESEAQERARAQSEPAVPNETAAASISLTIENDYDDYERGYPVRPRQHSAAPMIGPRQHSAAPMIGPRNRPAPITVLSSSANDDNEDVAASTSPPDLENGIPPAPPLPFPFPP